MYQLKGVSRMRKVSFTLSVLVLLAMLLTACGGQQTSTTVPAPSVPPVTVESTSTSAPTSAPTGAATSGVPVTGAENPSRLTNELKFSIVDQSGNKLGDVSDMVLDLNNTRISYIVTNSSSGSGSVLIPWDSVTLQTASSSTTTGSAQNAFVLQADPSVLKNAPTTDLTTVMPGMGQAAGNWDTDVQNYWMSGGSTTGAATSAPTSAATSAPTSAPTSAATSAPAVSSTSTSTSNTGTGTGTGMGTGALQGVALASQVIGTTITLSPGQGNGTNNGTGTGNTGTGSGTATEAPTSAATSAPTSAATSAPTSTSGTGTGTGTGNGLGNLQATVDDMIVETQTGMIQYLVVRTDFGSGEVLVPVVQWDATNNAFMLNVAPGILQNAPNFTSDQFPDTTTSGWDQQFSTYWQSNGGTSGGSGTGTGNVTATATP
jgi:sporulation protein YlmC with PRC-barrel domain